MKLPEKPFNIKELLDRDGKGFSNAIGDEDFRRLASEYNNRYFYWSELEYRIKEKSKREYLWVFMKLLRSNYYQKFSFKGINMNYSLLPEFNRKLHIFDKNLAGNLQIEGKSLNLQNSYIISSLMEEAIASSQLEGASTTRRIAKAMLRERRKPSNKSEQMIFNNYEAIQFVLKHKQDKITPEMILEIQRIVTKGTLEDSNDSGKFRDNNEISVSNHDIVAHIPPDYKEIQGLLEELCRFANDSSDEFVHPIIKGIVLHFLIGYVHPFNDGNGRTARSIFYWYMLSQGYWLFEYMSVSRRILHSRKNYDLAYLYTEYDDLDLTYFIKYNLEAIDDSLIDLKEYIKKQQEEQKKTREIIEKNPDFNLRQVNILEEFMKNPEKLFSIKEISQTYGIVYQTARTDILFLEKKKCINKKISGKTFFYSYKKH
jgi:Fic family protein